MIEKKDWELAKEAWLKVSKQAEIDQEQAALYLEVIEKKINSFN